MKGTRKIGQLSVLVAWLAAALTCGLPSGYAQESKRIDPPDGMTKVSPAMAMPAFSLPGLDGDAFNSSALQGKVVVVRFWATW